MFNITVITLASLATVGLMELLKVFLPENTGAKVKAAISVVLSIVIGVGLGFAQKLDASGIVGSTFVTVALVQFSYDFVLKLLKESIASIQAKIAAGNSYTVKIDEEVKKLLEKEVKE